ncbi:60S ribosome biogenesis protein Mak11 [Trichophyton tonsurans CBS 112818]|uniref:MAK11 n=2 Tax=Trichophyton TaxID=5550 RepID=F2PVZ8_TRIEC|nr:60S ribosome biogenesis protein Mak11 [Trichophyton tonsurans CBS 112818]EGE06066.1 MAK11 [Trichophyton equinum CBS 127.97]
MKRKREEGQANVPAEKREKMARRETTVQIVAGSYERVLHGINATISLDEENSKGRPANAGDGEDQVKFTDTFLFQAHTSAVRCLALSPMPSADNKQQQNVLLATGGTDDRINLYSLSVSPMSADTGLVPLPSLAGNKVLENPRNRELGALMHHSASITAMHFPTRSKLLSASEDNTIAVTRTRDWTVVSSIKAPHPKTQGRPSGDTAPAGGAPAGVNDFAVHPSMKLMLTVGKGEKSMRLWNLVTGRKAGVLNFGRDVLTAAKEGKWGTGEGRKIRWDSAGEEFAVAFEWGIVVFGVDSVPKCRVATSPFTKVHHISYLDIETDDEKKQLLVASTEDGRLVFYSTASDSLEEPVEGGDTTIPTAPFLFQLGGKAHGQSSRIKEFEILPLQENSKTIQFIVITSGSDGALRIWTIKPEEIQQTKQAKRGKPSKPGQPVQVGRLLGAYKTGNRITCMKAFIMREPIGEEELSEGDSEENDDDDQDEDDEDSDSP